MAQPNWASEYRVKHGITQQELADKLGVSKSLICRIENGERVADVETLVPIVVKKLRIRPSRVRPDLASILR
jgi:transcriptional regulator with XRE-family HTH domain